MDDSSPREGALARSWGQSPWVPVLAVSLVGLAWRLGLAFRFFGWEESDYGNLAMARGVLTSGFTRFDMNHCPMYYGLSAAVLALVGDAWWATRIVSLSLGTLALAVTTALGWRLGGPRVAWLVGALVLVQPELALYSSSALREPAYVGFFMLAVALLARERLAWASLAAAGAFLTRFDAMFIFGLLLPAHALGRAPRLRRLLASVAPLLLFIGLWSLYCHFEHGTFRFWAHSIDINLQTGGGVETRDRLPWALDGLGIVWALLTRTLPHHMGWLPALAAAPGALLLLADGHGARRVTGLAWVGVTGFWLAIGFSAQHEPDHNLYWKWMTQLVPLWGLAAAVALDRVYLRTRTLLGSAGAWVLLGMGLALTGWQHLQETQSQIQRARVLYLPQLRLAQEVEATIAEEVPLVLDNIPGCWVNRNLHGRTLWTWLDIPTPPGDGTAFARWIRDNRIGWVLWFREDWTLAPSLAPWLARGGVVVVDGVRFEERAREDQYGWIWYQVVLVDGAQP